MSFDRKIHFSPKCFIKMLAHDLHFSSRLCFLAPTGAHEMQMFVRSSVRLSDEKCLIKEIIIFIF